MSEQAITLAMTEVLWDELARALDDEREVAGVLSAQLVDHEDGEATLLGRNLTWASADTYADRFADGLALISPGWVPAARGARRRFCGGVRPHPPARPRRVLQL